MITQSELKELLHYDEDTGVFTWKSSCRGRSSCKPTAGYVGNGYVHITVLKKHYMAHRLAWLYVFGHLPLGEIDHINRIRSDNRISNLREVSRKQNSENRGVSIYNTTGFRGVRKENRIGKRPFVARITHHGKDIYIGAFHTATEASDAYVKKASELFTHFRSPAAYSGGS